MTLLEEDLLSAIKELLESSQNMTGGNFTADDMVRYQQSVEWSKRVITSAENGAKTKG